MKPLFTEEQFNLAKSMDKLPCECYVCKNTFYPIKKKITQELKNKANRNKFCSEACEIKSKNKSVQILCSNCQKPTIKKQNQLKDSKSTNHFCSLSCSATYNNNHKKHGTKRSKLEIYLEAQLIFLYPDLHIDFNKKNAIESELDIYIPSLKLAFELNGIFHYEPIFGVNKLNKIQTNDISKSKSCIDNKIDLCIIDTSHQKYFKPSTSKKYLDIIINIIKERLLTS